MSAVERADSRCALLHTLTLTRASGGGLQQEAHFSPSGRRASAYIHSHFGGYWSKSVAYTTKFATVCKLNFLHCLSACKCHAMESMEKVNATNPHFLLGTPRKATVVLGTVSERKSRAGKGRAGDNGNMRELIAHPPLPRWSVGGKVDVMIQTVMPSQRHLAGSVR